MFSRRIFASAPIPPHMYAALNISSAQQAARRLPSLVPVTASVAKSMGSSSLLQLAAGAGSGLAVGDALSAGGNANSAIMEQLSLIMLNSTLAVLMNSTINPCLWSDYSKTRTMVMKCFQLPEQQ